MYSTRTGIVLGFHGCDQTIVEVVVTKKINLKESDNTYDWLGHGIYFWENSPSRAFEYATFLQNHPKRAKRPITNPAIIGAALHLGFCLDLTDYMNLRLLKEAYEILKETIKRSGTSLPENKPVGRNNDLLIRELDCAVIETLHKVRKDRGLQPYDSVKGVFWEGKELYPNAGFREKDHIQICIRNPNCIKGYFLPRERNVKYPNV